MQVSHHSVVAFHYNLLNTEGRLIETTRDGGDPVLCLIGADNVLPGLEQALMGRSTGDVFSVELAPERAYGLRDENRQNRVPAKYLKHEGKLTPGKIVRIQTDQGVKTATVVKVGRFNVDVDMNHPLAGQSITFEVEVTDVRPAEAEEIDHGHAHGTGGHQH